jgi:hypothetical protein
MSDASLLGCPHCAKPISFMASLAGRTVACPHCRGPFQMPGAPPAPRSAPQAPVRREQPDEFGFVEEEGVQTSAGSARPPEFHPDREPPFYAFLEQLSTAFVYVSIVGAIFGTLSFMILVVPDFFRTDQMRAGIIAVVFGIFAAALGVLIPLMLRTGLLVLLDSARHLRAIRAKNKEVPNPQVKN